MPKATVACMHGGCHLRFPNKSTMRRHWQIHGRADKFKCGIDGCEKTYKFFPSVQKHRRTRHSKTPVDVFICEVCHKSCVDFTTMRVHLMKQHGFIEEDARFEARGMKCRPILVDGLCSLKFI